MFCESDAEAGIESQFERIKHMKVLNLVKNLTGSHCCMLSFKPREVKGEADKDEVESQEKLEEAKDP